MTAVPVNITIFRWAGSWGPFKVNIPCGECALTQDVVEDVLEKELQGVPVKLDVREWLTEWWKPLRAGGWHAPIVLVEGSVVSQGEALNRGLLTQAVTGHYAKRAELSGNHLFGKEKCVHCRRAKQMLADAKIDYTYHDVVISPRALYEMLARVKPLVGPKTPITVPQIWLGGEYAGGADSLEKALKER